MFSTASEFSDCDFEPTLPTISAQKKVECSYLKKLNAQESKINYLNEQLCSNKVVLFEESYEEMGLMVQEELTTSETPNDGGLFTIEEADAQADQVEEYHPEDFIEESEEEEETPYYTFSLLFPMQLNTSTWNQSL